MGKSFLNGGNYVLHCWSLTRMERVMKIIWRWTVVRNDFRFAYIVEQDTTSLLMRVMMKFCLPEINRPMGNLLCWFSNTGPCSGRTRVWMVSTGLWWRSHCWRYGPNKLGYWWWLDGWLVWSARWWRRRSTWRFLFNTLRLTPNWLKELKLVGADFKGRSVWMDRGAICKTTYRAVAAYVWLISHHGIVSHESYGWGICWLSWCFGYFETYLWIQWWFYRTCCSYQGANPDTGAEISLPKGALVTDVSMTLSGASATGWSQTDTDVRDDWIEGSASSSDSRSGESSLGLSNHSTSFFPHGYRESMNPASDAWLDNGILSANLTLPNSTESRFSQQFSKLNRTYEAKSRQFSSIMIGFYVDLSTSNF